MNARVGVEWPQPSQTDRPTETGFHEAKLYVINQFAISAVAYVAVDSIQHSIRGRLEHGNHIAADVVDGEGRIEDLPVDFPNVICDGVQKLFSNCNLSPREGN